MIWVARRVDVGPVGGWVRREAIGDGAVVGRPPLVGLRRILLLLLLLLLLRGIRP